MGTKGEKTKQQIRNEAYQLFSERGYKSVTMKDICEKTGLSRGGLYRHYDSTEQIFLEIIDGFTRRQKDEFTEKIAQQVPAKEILDDILLRYSNEMMDSSNSLSLAIYEFYSNPEISKTENSVVKQYEASKSMWLELINYGIENKEFKRVDAEAVFDVIVFSYQGVRMYSKLMKPDSATPGRIISEIKKLLLPKEETMEQEICLVRPTIQMKEQALEYREEHFKNGEKVINGSELFDQIESYEEWLSSVTLNTDAETVNENWVVTDTFFALRKSDNKIIGIIDLRHTLNEFLKDFGNCGYSVRPSERKKGYATEMLCQLKEVARKAGMQELHLSVEKTNIGSIKVIQNNGGVYERSFTYENELADIYRISL